MIGARPGKSAETPSKKDLSSFLEDIYLPNTPGPAACGPPLSSPGLGRLEDRMYSLFTISNIRASSQTTREAL
jgi:hypothetical protein